MQVKKIHKNPFFKSVAMLAGGSGLAQILLIAASPLLSRIYTPEDFGVLGSIISFMAITISIGALHYERAIPLTQIRKNSLSLLKLSFYLLLLITFITFVSVLIWGESISNILKEPLIEKYLWTVPFGVFFIGYYNSLSFLAIREKKFNAIAVSKVSQGVSAIIIQVLMGLTISGPLGLIVGHIFSQSVGLTFLKRKLNFKLTELKSLSHLTLKASAKIYKDFPLYSAPQSFINAVGQNIPTLILTSYFGASVAGFYVLTKQSLQKPMGFIGNSFRQAFYPKAVESYRDGHLFRILLKGTLSLFVLGFGPFVIIELFAEDLFGFMFGDKWIISGTYAKWMMLWVFAGFINIPSVVSIPVLNLQKSFFIYEILYTLSRIGVLFYGGMNLTGIETVKYFAIISSIFNLLLILCVVSYAKGKEFKK